MSNGTVYSTMDNTRGSSTSNSTSKNILHSMSGNSMGSSLNGIPNGMSNNTTYSLPDDTMGSSKIYSTSGNTMSSSTNMLANGSTDNSMGNSVSSVTPAHSSTSSSRPLFAPEQASLRQSSIDHSAASYPAPSDAALSGAQRQSPTSNTPTRFVKHEPVPVPTRHYNPYAPAPHTHNPRASQAAPSPQGLFFGASNYPAQYAQPIGNGHVQAANQSANTHTVSFQFHVLSPQSDASGSCSHYLLISRSPPQP